MKIEQLIEKYLNGETYLSEEGSLRKFLLSDDLEEKYKPLRDEFIYFEHMKSQVNVNPDFDDKLIKSLDSLPVKKSNLQTQKITYILSGIAACLLLMLGAYSIYHYLGTDEKNINALASSSVKDPKIAYEQTKKALLSVSSNLNKGTGKLQNLSKLTETIDQLSKLSELNKLENNLNRSPQ